MTKTLAPIVACALAVLLATSAWAGPLDDAQAGLAALNSGDNVAALALFTRALASGELAPADQELAYVKRAQAYAGLNDVAAAIADVREARRLDPDDAEAAGLLRDLEAHQARSSDGTYETADKPSGGTNAHNPAIDAQAAYQTQLTRYEAEKRAADAAYAAYQEQLRAWRARSEACKNGDASQCGK